MMIGTQTNHNFTTLHHKVVNYPPFSSTEDIFFLHVDPNIFGVVSIHSGPLDLSHQYIVVTVKLYHITKILLYDYGLDRVDCLLGFLELVFFILRDDLIADQIF